MRHTFTLALIMVIASLQAMAQDYPYEEHDYTVHWKWGLIDLNAASAHVTSQCNDGNFYGTIDGSSIDWQGRVYSVSDTLHAQLTPNAEEISYINGWYTKPKANTDPDLSNPANYKNILGQGYLSASPSTMEAVDMTANMLSLYYYARSIDFDSLDIGESVHISIDGPQGPQTLDIFYRGTGPSRSGVVDGDVHFVTFNYSYHGLPSAYPVRCEITVDDPVPVFFAADIRIGHVEMAIVD